MAPRIARRKKYATVESNVDILIEEIDESKEEKEEKSREPFIGYSVSNPLQCDPSSPAISEQTKEKKI